MKSPKFKKAFEKGYKEFLLYEELWEFVRTVNVNAYPYTQNVGALLAVQRHSIHPASLRGRSPKQSS